MKKYDNYKYSGIEWIGEIPEHWNTSALKWYAEIYSGGTPSKDIEEYWINGTIPWLNSGSVNQGDITEVSEYITEEALNKSSAKWIPENSLVMALAGQGKTKGMVAQVKFKTTCNQSLGVIVPNSKIDNRFLMYWLKNNYQNIRNLGGGDKRDGLNLVMLGGIPFPIPKNDEQTTIANYLDHKNSQIDTLIAKKEQLISLLQEERTAVINQAVTKGLDPNVKMKDSGIEWLGEIPEHWEEARIKNVVKIIGRIGFRGYTTEDLVQKGEGAISLSPSNIKNHILNIEDCTYLSWEKYHESPEIKIFENDIILVKTGSTIGKVAIIPSDTPEMTLNPQLVVFKDIKLNPLFLYYMMLSNFFQGYFSVYTAGGSTPAISQEKINNFKITFPETEEQIKISNFIAKNELEIKSIILKTQQEIELLKEYKTALISEVVTGKIDVRDIVLN